ncbi:hypothetical protein HGRIS_011646 [Hohenbuehelia grisea]|uniref:Carboxylesterase type B domain-containing protein n=1 Tax=Hohenbuehelia grisea TaxID=104357 RepID=A0ABR3JVQ5_9AGAR
MTLFSFKAQWVLTSLLLASSALAGPKVKLTSTIIFEGKTLSSGQQVFRGIPYAESPVGARRLNAPVAKTYTAGTHNAKNFGPYCIQPTATTNGGTMSEDCLTINVQRPAPAPFSSTTKIPVVVWIHSGAMTTGGSADPRYDATKFVQRGIDRGTRFIYVNFNYRLGPLGYPVGASAESAGILNLGLKDQILALQWVKDNIEFFGGDKDKITLAGDGAGGILVGNHLVNPSFGTLARAAILQSGVGTARRACGGSPCPRETAAWDAFVQAIPECASATDPIDCIRTTATTGSLTNAVSAVVAPPTGPAFSYVTVVETGVLPGNPLDLVDTGNFAHIPVIAGVTLDQGTTLSPSTLNSDTDFVNYIQALFPTATSTAITDTTTLYPDDPTVGSPYNTGTNTFGLSSQYKRIASLIGDVFYVAGNRRFKVSAAAASVPVYGYRFSDPQPQLPARLGVAQDSDFDYVYHKLPSSASTAAKGLSKKMADYWISFIVSLDPNDSHGEIRTETCCLQIM